MTKPPEPSLPPLELTGDEARQLVDSAMRHILRSWDPDQFPLSGSGVDWMHSKEFSAESRKALELAQSVSEPLPETGEPDFDKLLAEIFERLAPVSTNDNSPGYLAFTPGGGLFASVVADLISQALNRYVTIFMAAPGLAAIEDLAVRWLADILAMPAAAGGVCTSGGSTACLIAMHVARTNRLLSAGADAILRGTAYVSDQGHYCHEQSLILCGLPAENLRRIPSRGSHHRMCLDTLRERVAIDRAEGKRPFLVVGMAGTTNTGAVDDLDGLADFCRLENLWFHVDAAYGGFFMLTRRGRQRLRGLERADSVALDPHKSMFLPYGTGAIIVRSQDLLRESFSCTGACMHPQGDSGTVLPYDIMDLSHELTRDFRGLRIWLPLKMYGVAPFRDQLDEKLDLAEWAFEELVKIPDIEIVAEPQLSILAFKLRDSTNQLSPDELDSLNRGCLSRINRKGNILLSGLQTLRGPSGEFCIRMAILSHRTHRNRVELGLNDIREVVAEMRREGHDCIIRQVQSGIY